MQRIIRNNLSPSKNNEYPLFVISNSLISHKCSLFYHYFIIVLSLFSHYFMIICYIISSLYALDIIIFIILLLEARVHMISPIGPAVSL
jgi:hypothetical protein